MRNLLRHTACVLHLCYLIGRWLNIIRQLVCRIIFKTFCDIVQSQHFNGGFSRISCDNLLVAQYTEPLAVDYATIYLSHNLRDLLRHCALHNVAKGILCDIVFRLLTSTIPELRVDAFLPLQSTRTNLRQIQRSNIVLCLINRIHYHKQIQVFFRYCFIGCHQIFLKKRHKRFPVFFAI